MTKKYWNDWQKRLGETKQIYLCYPKRLLYSDKGERILSYKFNGDTVDLVIQRKRYVSDNKPPYYHYHVENEYITLNRVDIASIEFDKYKTYLPNIAQ